MALVYARHVKNAVYLHAASTVCRALRPPEPASHWAHICLPRLRDTDRLSSVAMMSQRDDGKLIPLRPVGRKDNRVPEKTGS